jgi:hypothetical protein
MHILVLKSVGTGRKLPAVTVVAVFLATGGQALGTKT